MTLAAITKYSIVRATQPIKEAKSSTLIERIWVGAKSTFITIPCRIAVIASVVSIMPPAPTKPISLSFSQQVLLYPFLEEVIFRLFLHGSLAIAQATVQKVAPNSWKENRTFKWLMSPSMRIITGTALFALMHLSNRNAFGLAASISQCAHIFLFPNEAIVYETHGFIASFSAHALNNLIAYCFSR